MSDFFELVDWSTGNVIDDFDSEEAALADLLTEGRQYGFDDIRAYALLQYQDGHPTLIAMEDDLVAYVRRLNDSQTAFDAPVSDLSSKASEFAAMVRAISSAVLVADMFSSKTLRVTATYDLILGATGARVTQGDPARSNSTETNRLQLVELIGAA